MASDARRENLSVTKTIKALFVAMHVLLKKQNFSRITTKDICEEALLSRATFYSHFTDKYDLLRHWIESHKPYFEELIQSGDYGEIEKQINAFIHDNASVIENIITDPDEETLDIVVDFVLSSLGLGVREIHAKETSAGNIVLATFFSGGMIKYVHWSITEKMPFGTMNPQVYGILKQFQQWLSQKQ